MLEVRELIRDERRNVSDLVRSDAQRAAANVSEKEINPLWVE